MIAALLAELTGTEPEFAYNLALAGFYATLVSSAYGLAGEMASVRGVGRRKAAVFAAFFVGLASNVATPLRAVASLVPAGAGIADTVGFGRGRFGSKTLAHGLEHFGYWDASGGMVGGINEFPLFAFLNGDLHAHMMSMPFLVLAAGLLFAYWRTPAEAVWERRALVFGAVPMVAGLVAVVNTWTFPSVAGLTVVTLALAPAHAGDLFGFDRVRSWVPRHRGRAEVERIASAAVAGVVTGLVGVVVTAPFFAGMVVGSTGNRSPAFFPDRAGMVGLLLVHGAFLAVAWLYLGRRIARPRGMALFRTLVVFGLLGTVTFLMDAAVLFVVVPALALLWVLARVREDVGYEAALFVAAAGLVALVEFLYVAEEAGPNRMNTVFKTYTQVWVMFSVAAGVMLADVSNLRDGWADFWSDVTAGARYVATGDTGREPATDGGTTVESGTEASTDRRDAGSSLLADVYHGQRTVCWANAGAVLAALLVVGLSVYPTIALDQHFGLHTSDDVTRPGEYMVGDPTLDATAYVSEDHTDVTGTPWNPDEAKAIAWVDSLNGQPNIVTAPGTLYRWTNAPSSLTGVPTLAGWPHEVGYRGREAYRERTADVRTIYTGSRDEQAALLAEYDVAYVYVGPNERSTYGTRLDVAGIDGVSEVRTLGAVTIYRVDQSQLST
jgi:YYY domain-containing protein